MRFLIKKSFFKKNIRRFNHEVARVTLEQISNFKKSDFLFFDGELPDVYISTYSKVKSFLTDIKKLGKSKRTRLRKRLWRRAVSFKKNFIGSFDENFKHFFKSNKRYVNLEKISLKTLVKPTKPKKFFKLTNFKFFNNELRLKHTEFKGKTIVWYSEKSFFNDVVLKLDRKKNKLLSNFVKISSKSVNLPKSNLLVYFLLNFCSLAFSQYYIKQLINVQNYKEKLNNLAPFYFLSKKSQHYILEKKKKRLPDHSLYAVKFLLTFFEKFFNLKTLVKVKFLKNTYKFLEKRLISRGLQKKHWKFQNRIGKGFFFLESMKVIWYTLLLKDCRFFLNWFRRTMERLYFKSQKKFLRFLKVICRALFLKYRKAINVRGFFFDIRGKVGVTGNAKKRHFFFKEGKSSFTEKRLKLSYYQDLVRTKTGVLGVTLAISQ